MGNTAASFDKTKKYSTREKIYIFCQKIHVLGFAQSLYRTFFKRDRRIQEHRRRTALFYDEYNELFNKIDRLGKIKCEGNVLISGYLSTFRKGGNDFFHKLAECIPGIRIIAFSHSGKDLTEKNQQQIEFEYLACPNVPFAGGYKKNLDVLLSDDEKQLIDSKQYLKDAVYNIKAYHDDLGDWYAEAIVYYLYKTMLKIISTLDLKLLIVHNVLYPMNRVMSEVCRENGIPTLFYEFGSLPGTVVLEDTGQMGASFPALHAGEFMKKRLNNAEVEETSYILDFFKGSGLNRNIQPDGDAAVKIKQRIKPQRPTILYAGQNDYDSGICPYNENARKFHSPIFENSDEAAIYLADLARKYDWNFIYKPHPLCVKHGKCLNKGLPENTIWISDVDINQIIDISDVVVTILSQVSEIALIRNKAVLMLGYTQLREKGCCYEAYKKDLIECELLRAVNNGFTEDQAYAYKQYAARMLKYYLFDDLSEREIRFGQNIRSAAAYVNDVLAGSNKNICSLSSPARMLPKYIFIESNMFADKIMSNELDFLNLFADTVGKSEIVVKLYNENSQLRFRMRGFKTILMSDEKWLAYINQGSIRGHVIIGAYPMHEFEQTAQVEAIWFYKMLVTKDTLSFCFRPNMKNNYVPKNTDSLLKLAVPEETTNE